MRKVLTAISTAILLAFGAGVPAHADTFTFSFDTLAAGKLSQGGGNTATSSIQGYMQSQLQSGQTVTVTGGVADKYYTGEGFVVGPGSDKNHMTSLTLGNTNGATTVSSNSTVNSTYDTFIANTDDNSNQISSQIVMKFSGLTINGTVSFDYEIFPDGTGQTPDLIFAAGPTGNTSTIFTMLGVTPGSSPLNTDVSDKSNNERNKQLIGHWSGSITNATELDFIDWPATIGIDNLVITTGDNSTTPPQLTPEPGSFVLLGTLVSGVFVLARKRRTA